MERLVFLPFSIGCASQNSVAVIDNSPKISKPESYSSSPESDVGKEENSTNGKMKFLGIRKPNVSSGIQKIVRSLKSLTELFVYKDEYGEEQEREMEIGLPTDVRHVTHWGADGCSKTNPSMGTDELKQFQLAMPSQLG